MQKSRFAVTAIATVVLLFAGCGEMTGDSAPNIPSQERRSEKLLERVEKQRDSYENAVEQYGEDSGEAASELRTARRTTMRAFETCQVLFDCPAYEDIHDIGSELGIDFSSRSPKWTRRGAKN